MLNNHMHPRLGFHKTNNLVEGYNHALGLSVPANAIVWTLIERFQEKIIMKKSLFQATKGIINTEDRKSCSVKCKLRDSKFQAVVSNFMSVPLKMFMEEVVSFFNK
jgi:hypothetical protein